MERVLAGGRRRAEKSKGGRMIGVYRGSDFNAKWRMKNTLMRFSNQERRRDMCHADSEKDQSKTMEGVCIMRPIPLPRISSTNTDAKDLRDSGRKRGLVSTDFSLTRISSSCAWTPAI